MSRPPTEAPAAAPPGAPAPARGLALAFEDAAFAWADAPDDPLLDGFTMAAEPGEVVAVVGPSGCGKSTLLRLAAGLLRPTGGRVVPGAPTADGCAFVFQAPTLLPWRTVADNVALPLELAGVPAAQARAAVAGALARVELEDAAFAWADAPDDPLLDGFTMAVEPGEVVAVVGPSGCGKSTLLRLAAGLLRPTGGRVVPGAPTADGCAFVFQAPTLLPWRTVADNVALPLELAGVPAAQARAAVAGALARVELEDAAELLPGALSGGMQMRVSLARAWVRTPRLLLLDEPFGALDALTRQRLHGAFQALWEDGRPTVLMVTHDIDEAVLLADRVVVVSGRPLRVAGEVPVPLPHPRDPALRHDPAVGERARAVEALL